MKMSEKALRELASLYGLTIDTGHDDDSLGTGNEVLISFLAGIGVDIRSVADAETILEQERNRQWQSPLEPVMVIVATSSSLSIPIQLPEDLSIEFEWALIEESDCRHAGRFFSGDLPITSRFEGSEQTYARRVLALEIPLEWGYHDFFLRGIGDNRFDSSTRLIVTPETSYVPHGLSGDNRIWGVSAYLHAVRSGNNWGIGDFSDLRQILAWSAEKGAGTLHVGPLHALIFSDREPPTPYRPSSRTARNVLFLDVAAIHDCKQCNSAHASIEDLKFQARLAMVRDQDQLDYDAIIEMKLEILKVLWHHFVTNHLNPETRRGAEFRQFQKQGGDTFHYFGIYETIGQTFHVENRGFSCWRDWPEQFRRPNTDSVRQFAAEHEYEIEFFQYLQWQADLQVAAIGLRSMELGLKVGLLQDLAHGPSPNGFDAWYYQGLFLDNGVVARNPQAKTGCDPCAGLAPCLPSHLRQLRYTPLIESLRHAMEHAGAVLIRGFAGYATTYVTFTDVDQGNTCATLHFPFEQFLGILLLESQRNRCLVIVDNVDLLPDPYQQDLTRKKVFIHSEWVRQKDANGAYPTLSAYPKFSALTAAPSFLATLKGFWSGKDIALCTDQKVFQDDLERESAIVTRASDRAHLLIALQHEDLLPEGYDMDPVTVPELASDICAALYVFVARTPAKILLASFADFFEMEDQAEPPELNEQPFWQRRYPVDLERLDTQTEVSSLLAAFCRERGWGIVRPSALTADRKKKAPSPTPTAFYRLQLHKHLNFVQAAEVIPYLKDLGISHCYASPFLMARPGSPHGYDIINHSAINPEFGNRQDFEHFIAVLEENRMALLLDVVPNHMGVGSDNDWWMDVLENGKASIYGRFFDINWTPQQPGLAGCVLLPVLGGHYGTILENGELNLDFDENEGCFYITYYEHRFPVAPETYPKILTHDLHRLEDRLGSQHTGYLELQAIASSLAALTRSEEMSDDEMVTRHRYNQTNKRILARLCRENPDIQRFIEENVIFFNGTPGKPESFDLLHDLLENQAYRVAFWRVAADEINYRRFFDINELAGLCMERLEVFQKTHQLVLDWIATGKLDGLRVDHPDGLYDPYEYFSRLQIAAAGDPLDDRQVFSTDSDRAQHSGLYVVVEKILADFEHLPSEWPVDGTTGYDFSNMVNGLFVDSSAEKFMTSIYHRFIGTRIDFDELVYKSKELIIRSAMAGEMNVLASGLYWVAQANRHTRDFTLNRLRELLTEVVASFPVYRTYVPSGSVSKYSRNFIEWAVAKAKARGQLEDESIYRFIRDVLLLENEENESDIAIRRDFVMKFQQYTGPVMAKGLEDTAFYIYNRLLSLNEVGGEPKRFGTSIAAFHRTNQDRLRHWPRGMVNTSTHDSKRSEDVRVRINVLSELPHLWQKRVSHWHELNKSLKIELNGLVAPTKNDEYAFYQNLLGAWPFGHMDTNLRQSFVHRMKDCMLKSIREAKQHTSWINPNTPYEDAMVHFVEAALADEVSPFIQDFCELHQMVSWFGMFNSLSQVLLKLTSPGIPDIYQGNEIWRLCMVDPDNRRSVDFQKRRDLLYPILERMYGGPEQNSDLLQDLLMNLKDGRAKLFTMVKTLRLRNECKEVFDEGAYLPLTVRGEKKRHVCAFARKQTDKVVVVIAPRLYAKLMGNKIALPLGETVWSDTAVSLPEELIGLRFHNLFPEINIEGLGQGKNMLPVASMLREWPVGLLVSKVA